MMCLLFTDTYSFLFSDPKLFKLKLNKNKYNLKTNSNKHSKKYTVIHNKKNIVLTYNNITEYFHDNDYLKDKKVINIYPAGIKGFYEMGISTYIKERYNLEHIVFSGASAGAWNSLMLSYKGNISEFNKIIFDINFHEIKSIYKLQCILKQKLMLSFSSDDFELEKLFIGVTVFEHFFPKTYIYTDFVSLEDALDCIIASSNIPCITGKFFCYYKNKLSFDGGFRSDPFIHHPYKSILIHPSLLKQCNILNDDYPDNMNDKKDNQNIIIEDNHFIVDNNKFKNLFYQGYQDAIKYKHIIKRKLKKWF